LLTLNPSELALNESLIKLIPPKPMGYYRSRESMPSNISAPFDPVAIAGSASMITLKLLLQPERANRLEDFHYRDSQQPGLESVLSQLIEFCMNMDVENGLQREISHLIIQNSIYQMMALSRDERSNVEVVAVSTHAINTFKERLIQLDHKGVKEDHDILHYTIDQINKFQKDPTSIVVPLEEKAPDGSPIGSFYNYLKMNFWCY